MKKKNDPLSETLPFTYKITENCYGIDPKIIKSKLVDKHEYRGTYARFIAWDAINYFKYNNEDVSIESIITILGLIDLILKVYFIKKHNTIYCCLLPSRFIYEYKCAFIILDLMNQDNDIITLFLHTSLNFNSNDEMLMSNIMLKQLYEIIPDKLGDIPYLHFKMPKLNPNSDAKNIFKHDILYILYAMVLDKHSITNEYLKSIIDRIEWTYKICQRGYSSSSYGIPLDLRFLFPAELPPELEINEPYINTDLIPDYTKSSVAAE